MNDPIRPLDEVTRRLMEEHNRNAIHFEIARRQIEAAAILRPSYADELEATLRLHETICPEALRNLQNDW